MKRVNFEPTPVSESLLLMPNLMKDSKYFLFIEKKNFGDSVMMQPVINKLVEEFHERINFYTIEFNNSKKIRKLYHIETAPCFLIFNNNNLEEIIYGLIPGSDLKQLIENHLS